jgi:hypothetical protein
MKGQQAFQKTNALADGPKYCLEDDELAAGVELKWVSSKKASGKSHKETTGTVTIVDDKVKKSGRQANLLRRIVARTAREDTKSPSVSEKRQENRMARIMARMSPEDTNPPTLPPTMEGEQDDQDGKDVTPGAVRVPGNIDSVRRGDDENGRTVMPVQETHVVPEAKVVEEGDTEQVVHRMLQEIEQATRRKINGEVPQADIVEDNRSKTRRWALLGTGIVVILLVIVIGTVLGTRDTSSSVSAAPSPAPSLRSSSSPSLTPLNNSICEEALPIMLDGSAIAVSLIDAAPQYVDFCGDENKVPQIQPGLWYRVRGLRGA